MMFVRLALVFATACATPRTPVESATSVVAVLPVADHAASTAWYRSWIGRDADVKPVEGVAEWQLANGGWIQVAADAERAGQTSVVVVVPDVDAQRTRLTDAGVTAGEVLDYGVVKLVEVADPDGNTVVFVQEIEG